MIRLKNKSYYIRKTGQTNWWLWSCFLEADMEEELDDIRHVIYYLPQTSNSPIVKAFNRYGGFPVSGEGWEPFIISAKVTFKSGKIPMDLRHELEFKNVYYIVNDTIYISSKKFQIYIFTIPNQGHITGDFTSCGCYECPIQYGGIQVLILDISEFPDWQNRIMYPEIEYFRPNQKKSYYNSSYTLSDKINISLNKGEYVLIFNNGQGSGMPSNYDKNVVAKVSLEYT